MSKQSERKRRELAKAKADAKLSQAQQDGQNLSFNAQSDTKSGKQQQEKIRVASARNLIERPGFIAIIATVCLGVSAFIQIYSHTCAIWVLFLSLCVFSQALRVEIKEHKKSDLAAKLTRGILMIASLSLCLGLQIIEMRKPAIQSDSNQTEYPLANLSVGSVGIFPTNMMSIDKAEIADVVSQSMASYKNRTERPYSETNVPGFSWHFILQLFDQVPGEDRFIADTGQSIDRNRISIFIDPQKNLCFRVIGDNFQPTILQVNPSFETFVYGNTMWLDCEYGMSANVCLMRMFLNGKMVAENLQASRMESPEQWQTFNPVGITNGNSWLIGCHTVLGADMNCQNGARFMIGQAMFMKATTTDDELPHIGTALEYVEGMHDSKQTIEEQVVRYSKLAQARQWQPPELPSDVPGGPNGSKLIYFKFGGVTEHLPVRQENNPGAAPVIFPGGLVVHPYIKNNRLYVKSQTMFGDTEQTIEMNDEWPTKIPDGYDRNFNENAFEIVDNDKLPVLQIRYDAADMIEIHGIFVGPNGGVTVAFGDSTESFPPGRGVPPIPDRKVWFRYPSTNNLGVLANP